MIQRIYAGMCCLCPKKIKIKYFLTNTLTDRFSIIEQVLTDGAVEVRGDNGALFKLTRSQKLAGKSKESKKKNYKIYHIPASVL